MSSTRIAKPVRELGTRAPWLHEGGVRGIDIARDGNTLPVGDAEARRWMLATGEMALRTERGPRDGSTWDGYLFPDLERYLAWVRISDEKFVFRWWDLRTGAYLGEVPLADGIKERSILAMDRDGRRALMSTGDERCVPAIVSLEDGTVIRRLDGASERAIFLSDGRIVAPDLSHELRIWDAEGTSWKTLAPPRPVPAERNEPGTQRVTYLAASRTHPFFAIGYDYDFVVFTNDGKELFEKIDHWNPAVFSRSGERVAVMASGRIVLYDMAGNEQGAVSTDAVPLDAFAIGLDHRMLIGAQGSGEIHARSTTASAAALVEPPRKETVLPGDIYSMSGAPGGGTLALSCGSGPLLLWREGQTVPTRLPGTGRSSAVVRWLSDDRLLVITSYILRVLSARTHELFTEFAAPGDVLSPDARLGALGSNSGRTLIFETETGRQRSDLILEGTTVQDAPPSFGFFQPNERFCISNAGGCAWLMRNQLRAWDPAGRLRAETSLDRFVAQLPETAYSYWRNLEWLSDDELLLCDSLSGLFKFDVARNEWTTLLLEKDLQFGAIDHARRRLAVSRQVPELGDWGMSIVDIDTANVVLEIPSGGKLVRSEFLSDGSIALSTPDRRVVVWEAP